MSTPPARSRWLAGYQPNPRAALRLFCFPYAGGAASVFHLWSKFLSPNIEVCPIQLPGRGARMAEPPLRRMDALVEVLSRELAPYFDKPFAFFGHSMGAVIGFELAHRLLQQRQFAPVHLFVSGRRAPQIPDHEPPTYNLPERDFLEALRQLEGTPPEVLEHEELMQLLMPLLRADFELIQTYEYTERAPLACPLTAFGGVEDAEVNREELEAWREQTNAAFKLRMLPGDHFFLNKAQSQFLEILSHELGQVVRGMAHGTDG